MGRALLVILVSLMVATCSGMSGAEDGQAPAVREALGSGQPVVITVVERMPSEEQDGEAYADWAAYLNDFGARNQDVRVFVLEEAEAARLLAVPPALDQGHATVFARSPANAILYEGWILEPFVYAAGADYLRSPDAAFDEALFEPYKADLR